ncbi:MAG TPA: hypothetical protein DCY47_07360 [Candidatus Accumulibacter sp.]|nr:hypothetical protein [Accumulibacter sp.]
MSRHVPGDQATSPFVLWAHLLLFRGGMSMIPFDEPYMTARRLDFIAHAPACGEAGKTAR